MTNYQVTVAITQYVRLVVAADTIFEAEDAAEQYVTDHLSKVQERFDDLIDIMAHPANITAAAPPDLVAVAGSWAPP